VLPACGRSLCVDRCGCVTRRPIVRQRVRDRVYVRPTFHEPRGYYHDRRVYRTPRFAPSYRYRPVRDLYRYDAGCYRPFVRSRYVRPGLSIGLTF
jgi:hypothetical protein